MYKEAGATGEGRFGGGGREAREQKLSFAALVIQIFSSGRRKMFSWPRNETEALVISRFRQGGRARAG